MLHQRIIRSFYLVSIALTLGLFRAAPASSQTSAGLHSPCPAANASRQLITTPAAPPAGEASKSGQDKVLDVLSTAYDCGHPTAEEQLMLEYINFARANPDSEGTILSTTQDPGVVNEYNGFPSSSRSEVATDFPTYPSRPPLAMNPDLLTAARDHDREMIIVDSQYHVGPDGTPFTRMTNAGYTDWTDAGENVFAFGDSDVFYDDAAFLIDFGNSDLGHRHNIMNFGTSDAIYTEVGVGMVAGNGSGNPNGNVGPVLTTEDFVTGPNVFVLGVVYSDSNQNGFYDEGEGDSGVKIALSSGSNYYAISSGSGGYAIPYTGSGSVTVTASGGVFKTPVMKSVDLSGVNAKVDFVVSFTGYPTQVSLLTPIGDTTISTDTADLVWSSVAVAQFYHIEVATDAQMKHLVLNDSTLTNPMLNFGGLKETTTYYWRVQAKNAKGIGEWSPIDSFFVNLVPNVVTLLSPANGAFVGDTNITFTWESSNYTPFEYQVIVCGNNAMTSDTVFQDLPSDTTDVVDASSFLSPGQTYYWEVLAQNTEGFSEPSAVWSFTTASASVAPSGFGGSPSITISPNPSQGSAQIHFTLGNSDEVTLRVYNALGEKVQSLDLGQFSAGDNEYLWDCSGLAAGSYACELSSGSQTISTRIVILK